MSMAETARANGASHGVTLAIFAATLFLSAFLLFGVQPMFTKMVLPQLGGTPAVWSVAMVVFQTLLLAGYAYAHLSIRAFGPRTAIVLHLVLMGLALPFLPIAVTAWAGEPPAEGQAFWLVGVFLGSIGLPFLALAANGPLLQAWFARTGHPQADDPYFLYGASNIGSFAALLAYPFLVEPLLPLSGQSRAWLWGFVALAGAILVCGGLMLRGRQAPEPSASSGPLPGDALATRAAPVTMRDRLTWIGLAGVPSGLLVAVTAHISTDVAAAPLLWVVPLALYLLTFVLAFRDGSGRWDAWLIRAHVWGVGIAFFSIALATSQLWWTLSAHLGAFLAAAFACHLALYRSRPSSAHLTEFYLYISLGGMIGGLFCGLIAPYVFSNVVEYPLALLLSLLAVPLLRGESWRQSWEEHRGAVLIGLALVFAGLGIIVFDLPIDKPFAVMVGSFAAATMLVWRATQPMLALALATMIVIIVVPGAGGGRETIRSFFGVHKIVQLDNGRFRALMHGTTVHGAMRIKNPDGTPYEGRPEPTTYYAFDGAIGDGIAKIRESRGGRLGAVAAIGLGTGSLACHIRPGEAWTYYEIDPDVVRIAREPRYFRFLSDCAPDLPIVLGDARLKITGHPGQADLIVVDAFSSDAIPTHLMTREAIRLYAGKLTPTGAALFHISNRHMDLSKVLAATAAAEGFQLYLRHDEADEGFRTRFKTPAMVAVLARRAEDVAALAGANEWRRIEPPAGHKPWTDDYANILRAIADHHVGR